MLFRHCVVCAIILVSVWKCLGWCQMKAVFNSNKSSRQQQFLIPIEKSKPCLSCEPAGAASIFSTAKSMRKNVVPALKDSALVHALQRRKSQISRKIKLRRQGQSTVIDIQGSPSSNKLYNNAGLHTFESEKEKETLSLPSWACEDKDEEKRLQLMKSLLKKELKQVAKQPTQFGKSKLIAFPDVYGDLRLLRFLKKDKKQDPVAAAERYRQFITWRQENDIDQIRSEVERKPFLSPNSVVTQYMPSNTSIPASSLTKAVPIILYLGSWQTAALTDQIRTKKLSLNDFLYHWIYLFEALHRHLYRESFRLQELVYVDEICDLKNLKLTQLSPGFVSKVLKPWLNVTQAYYPETTKSISLLNPPKSLSILWNIVAVMVNKNTISKVKLYQGHKGTVQDFVQMKHGRPMILARQ